MPSELAQRSVSPQKLVAKFNERFPVGTPVRYWKGSKRGPWETGKTRTGAEVLSGHTAVVWIEGEAGCIALSHVEPL